MLLVDTDKHIFAKDEELKIEIAQMRPVGTWLQEVSVSYPVFYVHVDIVKISCCRLRSVCRTGYFSFILEKSACYISSETLEHNVSEMQECTFLYCSVDLPCSLF